MGRPLARLGPGADRAQPRHQGEPHVRRPGHHADIRHRLTRGAARSWWMLLLLNEAVLIVAGSAERMLTYMPLR
jgi:hypothetical protein